LLEIEFGARSIGQPFAGWQITCDAAEHLPSEISSRRTESDAPQAYVLGKPTALHVLGYQGQSHERGMGNASGATDKCPRPLGNLAIGTQSPNATLDVNSTSIIIEQSHTPADNATCTAGAIWWDVNYIYVCTASATVKRATLSTY
jgi:hypothetical protein